MTTVHGTAASSPTSAHPPSAGRQPSEDAMPTTRRGGIAVLSESVTV